MKLLLVEDELSLSRAMTAILQKNGYTVDAVYNGREALEYMKADEYDGVILDLILTAKSEVDSQVPNCV